MGVKCFRLTKKKSVVCLFCRFFFLFLFRLLFVVFSLHVKAEFFFRTRKTCEMTRVISSFVSLSLSFFVEGTTPEKELVVCFGYRLFLDIILSLYF